MNQQLMSENIQELTSQRSVLTLEIQNLQQLFFQQSRDHTSHIEKCKADVETAKEEKNQLEFQVESLSNLVQIKRENLVLLEKELNDLHKEIEQHNNVAESQKTEQSRDLKSLNIEIEQYREETAKFRVLIEKLNVNLFETDSKNIQLEEQLNKAKFNLNSVKTQLESQTKVTVTNKKSNGQKSNDDLEKIVARRDKIKQSRDQLENEFNSMKFKLKGGENKIKELSSQKVFQCEFSLKFHRKNMKRKFLH